MAGNEHFYNGFSVVGHCIFCGREPEPKEVYGSGPDDWDFMNICPECWNDAFKEEDEDEDY